MNQARIEKWKEAKVKAWQVGGKLRRKFPNRADLDRWIGEQVNKAWRKLEGENDKKTTGKNFLIVIGVPRSGTSMLTHALVQAGAVWKGPASLPLRMEKKKDKNPEGFWELHRVFKLNWRYLHLQGIRGRNYFSRPRFHLPAGEVENMRVKARGCIDRVVAGAKAKEEEDGGRARRCMVMKILRMEHTYPLWTGIQEIAPQRALIVMPIRSPAEVVESTWEYWKSSVFWKHCILKILDMCVLLRYSLVLTSHRHLLTDSTNEIERLFKVFQSQNVPGLDAAKVTCINPKLWRCRTAKGSGGSSSSSTPSHPSSSSSSLAPSSAATTALPEKDYPEGVRTVWRRLLELHSSEPLLTPDRIKSILGEIDDRATDGYEETMAKCDEEVAAEEHQRMIKSVSILLAGFGRKVVGIITSYLEDR